MPDVLIQKATELRPETRAALEAELGRVLEDDEEVSIMALSAHEAPTGPARVEAARRLQEHLNRVDRATGSVSEQEKEAAIDESLRNVRPGYRESE